MKPHEEEHTVTSNSEFLCNHHFYFTISIIAVLNEKVLGFRILLMFFSTPGHFILSTSVF